MSREPQTRREFLRSTARTVLLGSVGVIGALLFRRGRDCANRGGCGGCNLYIGCALPWREEKR